MTRNLHFLPCRILLDYHCFGCGFKGDRNFSFHNCGKNTTNQNEVSSGKPMSLSKTTQAEKRTNKHYMYTCNYPVVTFTMCPGQLCNEVHTNDQRKYSVMQAGNNNAPLYIIVLVAFFIFH